jgi:transcriptional regulator with XRE-family HTH domain
MEGISERISTIIRIKNLSNAEFAQAIGVQPSNISHILSGRNKPSLDLIMKILKRYPEIRLNWLVLGKGAMNEEAEEVDLFSSAGEERQMKPERSARSTLNDGEAQIKDENPVAYGGYANVGKEKSSGENARKEAEQEKESRKISHDAGTPAVEKVIVFYSDRSFEEYFPRK